MFSWLFLSFGLTLGMIWAYEELGWGGYWAWDPVENAGAAAVVHGDRVPALGDGAGAAQHAARLERHARHRHVLPDDLRHVHDALGRRAVGARVRRRSDAGAAVHRLHGRDPGRSASAWSSTGCRCSRRATSSTRGCRARRRSWSTTGSCCSRRSSSCSATMFPTLSEAVTGERLTVAGAVLQQVDGADRPRPAVPDRRRAAARVAQVDADATCATQFLWPVALARSRPPALRSALGIPRLGRRASASRCARSSSARSRRSSGAARTSGAGTPAPICFTALVGLVGRNKRRYGGYIVHLGIVLIFLGFAGNALQARRAGAAEAGRRRPRSAGTRSGTTA